MSAEPPRGPVAPADWVARAESAVLAAGHRSTLPRSAIIELLARQDCVLTADEIAQELHTAGGRRVGIATVYRTLELLEELGLLQRLDIGDGLARFEPAVPGGGHHHHHFVCSRCGRVTPFEDPVIERAIEDFAARFGEPVSEHDVILRGRTCSVCEPR
jgi:Fur family transcriptional regulator, ferric uptake regulator